LDNTYKQYQVDEDENMSVGEWVADFSNRYDSLMRSYTPYMDNSAMKGLNSTTTKPDKDSLQKWLLDPQNNENNLQNFSLFLNYVVTEYHRLTAHVGNLLDYDYFLTPLEDYPTSKRQQDIYEYDKQKTLMWLEDFNLKDQFNNITPYIVIKGGGFYFLRVSGSKIVLQEMPDSHCFITGKDEYGYKYSMDMTFFDQYPSYLQGYASEFNEWYNRFKLEREFNHNSPTYKQMPVEKSVVFKTDEFSPVISPMFSGTFKDALQIEDYKDLLRLRTELDTWKVIFQEIPKDKDGKPTINTKVSAQLNQMVQAQLPEGVYTASTPSKIQAVSFDNTQNMNNISGKGQDLFWKTTGVASMFNGDTKGNFAVKMSILSDYNAVSQLYDQYERFVNRNLDLITDKYKFRIKFLRRCSYFKDEDTEKYFKYMQGGLAPEMYLSSMGLEPYEMEKFLKSSVDSGIRDLLVPTMTSHTMTSNAVSAEEKMKTGNEEKRTKNDSELTDAGATTSDTGSNDERMV
jgi:hypothetical protein